jgi:DNA polymerase-1
MGFQTLPPAIKVSTRADAEKCLAALGPKHLIAFDTETTGLVRGKDHAVLLSLSDGVGRWAVWPQAIPYFKDFLEDPARRLIGHNANFDQWMLLVAGIDLDRHTSRAYARVLDTMVMHALLEDDCPHDLKYLARKYLDIEMVPFKTIYGAQMRTRTLTEIFLDPANEEVTVNYSALDAYATYKLFLILQRKLQTAVIDLEGAPFQNLWDYYVETELLFTKVLWHMERQGILLSVETLLSRAPVLEDEIAGIRNWFCKQLRRFDLNLNSNPQMCALFFGKLGYAPLSYTAEGAPQLSKVVLQQWARQGCPYAINFLRYRDLKKQLDTYVIGLLDHIGHDGRVHPSFNQTGARTGRLSSSQPNAQNMPEYIRDSFVATAGYVLLARDQQQLEMRITAHVSGDKTLCDAINQGKDSHSATAATMYGVSYEELSAAKAKDDRGEPLTAEEKALLKKRKSAKTLNFGILYGMGVGKLAAALGITIEEARETLDRYFAAVPGIKAHFDRITARARLRGYSETVLGRRRQVRGIWSSYAGDVAQAERQVKNAPIQGFASEILKVAMNDIWCDEFLAACGVRMLIQVHDELVFEIPVEFANDPRVNERIHHHMCSGITKLLGKNLLVPLDTSGKQGDNWAACK